MRADLAREEIGLVSFETAQGGGGGIAGRPDVYIATAVVSGTFGGSPPFAPVS
jgi:hypothetical protein